MVLKRFLFALAACAALALLIWQPLVVAAGVAAFVAVSFAVLLPPRHGLTTGLLLAATVLILVPTTQVKEYPGGSLYGPIVAFCFLAFGLVKQRKDLRLPKAGKVVLVLYATMVVSTFAVGVIDWFYLPLTVIGALVFVSALNLSPSGQRVLAWYIIAMGIFQTLLAIFEVRRGLGPFIGTQITITVKNPFLPGYDRAQGTLDHPLVLGIILLIALGCLNVTRMRRVFKLLIGAFLLVGVFLTGGSSTLATAAVVVLWNVTARKTRLGKFVVRAALVIGLIYATFGALPIGHLLENPETFNVEHRLGSVQAIPNLLNHQDPYNVIFGNGMGPVKYLFERGIIYNDGFPVIDNQFVAVIVEAGLFGFCLFLWLLWAAFTKCPRNVRPAVLVLLFMTTSFDYLLWYSLLIPVLGVLGLALSPNQEPIREPEIVAPLAGRRPAHLIGRSPSGAML